MNIFKEMCYKLQARKIYFHLICNFSNHKSSLQQNLKLFFVLKQNHKKVNMNRIKLLLCLNHKC